ncbi:hypothetical protein AAEP93_007131 [Penicillium crustosum]
MQPKSAGLSNYELRFPSEGSQASEDSFELGEERRVRRKVDVVLLPILALAFFALQLDRGNMSAALTSTITQDLKITTNHINIGQQLLSAGICITEIPSNMALQRFGPVRWLSFQILAWGLVATLQAFVKGYPAFLATRLLLGLLEGGFIPGALFYLSSWYKKNETTLRVSLFFFGQMFSAATSSLISAGVLRLSGRGGLSGWQWIFLIEGLVTLFIAIVFALFSPSDIGNGQPLISRKRWSYFTERESYVIRTRMQLYDDGNTAPGKVKITVRDVWNTVRRLHVLQHCLFTLVSMSALSGLLNYTPSIIKSFGFDAVTANSLASVPIFSAMLLILPMSWLSDCIKYRGLLIFIPTTWNVIGYACIRCMAVSSTKWHKYAVFASASASYANMQYVY